MSYFASAATFPFAFVGVADGITRAGCVTALGIANIDHVDFVFAVGLALVFAVVVVEGLVVAAFVVVFGLDLARNRSGCTLVGSLRHSSLFAFHVPVVEIEPALFDDKEQVVYAGGIGHVEGMFFPSRT